MKIVIGATVQNTPCNQKIGHLTYGLFLTDYKEWTCYIWTLNLLLTDWLTVFFLFIDPPYYGADQKKFYRCNFDYEDHLRLSDCLRRNSDRLRFLITYDNHPDIWNLYDWACSIDTQEWNYTINRTDDQRNGLKLENGYKNKRYKGKEIFIYNYENYHEIPCLPEQPSQQLATL